MDVCNKSNSSTGNFRYKVFCHVTQTNHANRLNIRQCHYIETNGNIDTYLPDTKSNSRSHPSIQSLNSILLVDVSRLVKLKQPQKIAKINLLASTCDSQLCRSVRVYCLTLHFYSDDLSSLVSCHHIANVENIKMINFTSMG